MYPDCIKSMMEGNGFVRFQLYLFRHTVNRPARLPRILCSWFIKDASSKAVAACTNGCGILSGNIEHIKPVFSLHHLLPFLIAGASIVHMVFLNCWHQLGQNPTDSYPGIRCGTQLLIWQHNLSPQKHRSTCSSSSAGSGSRALPPPSAARSFPITGLRQANNRSMFCDTSKPAGTCTELGDARQ